MELSGLTRALCITATACYAGTQHHIVYHYVTVVMPAEWDNNTEPCSYISILVPKAKGNRHISAADNWNKSYM